MIQALVDHINGKIQTKLTDSEIEILSSVFRPKKLRKHQYLLQAGELCDVGAFVVKGALKKYTIDDQGKENILELYIENWWAADRESLMTGTPSRYYIDAFEPSELLLLSKADFMHTLNKLPFFAEFNNALMQRQSMQLIRRLHNTKSLTAEQKLAELQETYPEFLQRFPQHIIASYLGMTKETLSRIRSNATKK